MKLEEVSHQMQLLVLCREGHFYSFKVEEREWIALKVGEEVDHHGLDIFYNIMYPCKQSKIR